MAIAFKRIVLMAAIAATIAAYAVLRPAQRPAVLPAARAAPWVGLPNTGMDASQRPLRQALRSREHAALDNDRMDSLASLCGEDDHPVSERYVAHLSQSAWGPFRQVMFDVDGDRIRIAIRDGAIPLPPPPPPRAWAKAQIVETESVRPVSRIELTRAQAEPIRKAWSSYALWHAQQQPVGCHDGMPITLEACVEGRYALRHRNCNPEAYVEAQALWDAVRTLVPEPEPMYQRPVR